MSKQEKKRLCWGCEGAVPQEAENCPFCGVYLSPSSYQDEDEFDWEPPYQLPSDESLEEEPQPQEETPAKETPTPQPSATSEHRLTLSSIVLLISGITFFLFSLFLFIFAADDGTVTLRWSSTYWYAYLVAALPMTFFGWRLMDTSD